jgi:ribosomal protein S6--L-glutamate ligase
MKLWLFSHLESSPANRLLEKEATERGHDFKLVRPHELHLRLGEESREKPDLVFARTGSSAPLAALSRLAVLEQSGFACLNSSSSMLRSRNKAVSYAHLAAAKVRFPKTVVVGSVPLDGLTAKLGGPPWIVKLAVSTKGQGVCLVESERSLRSVVDALRETSQVILLQEFVAEAQGADIRVIVLGGKALVAAKRQAGSEDEFRSNVYLGGGAQEVDLEPEMASLAERAAAAMGLEVAGVDLLNTAHGFTVVEVNGSPGLTVSPRLPSLVMDYLEQRARL